jgi:uncharacterized protein (TIGR02271 family)
MKGLQMIGQNDITRIENATAYDSSGEKIGKVGQVYLDDESGEPTWVTVATGLFGLSESFVPLGGARFDGDDDIRLLYDKDAVKNAPRIDHDEHLDPEQEQQLFHHYGLGASLGTERSHDTAGTTARTPGSSDRDGVRTGEQAVTLSEEHLVAGKERVEAGRARLRKYTTTHTEQVEVQVTKEKLVVERAPVSGEAAARPIEDAGEQVEVVTLYEERPVVTTQTVPVEQVRIGKEQVTETETVSGEVRKEHADLDVDDGRTKAEARREHEVRYRRRDEKQLPANTIEQGRDRGFAVVM